MSLINFIFLLIIVTLMDLWAILSIIWVVSTNIGWLEGVLSIYGRMQVK
ncbi:MAG: hypothetical protein ACFFDC_05805 [Promethearchaeota archaeon]